MFQRMSSPCGLVRAGLDSTGAFEIFLASFVRIFDGSIHKRFPS